MCKARPELTGQARRGTGMLQVGQVMKWDHQSDVFHGEYRLVKDLGGGKWEIEELEPSDELIDEVLDYYLNAAHPYLDYVDPFGPGRRRATRQESADQEIMNRIDRAGTIKVIQFVSQERWASAF